MERVKFIRNRSMREHPCDSVSAISLSAANAETSISSRPDAASPQPAPIGLVDLGPEAFSKSFEGYVSKGYKVHPVPTSCRHRGS